MNHIESKWKLAQIEHYEIPSYQHSIVKIAPIFPQTNEISPQTLSRKKDHKMSRSHT